jgi:hypothetical protein
MRALTYFRLALVSLCMRTGSTVTGTVHICCNKSDKLRYVCGQLITAVCHAGGSGLYI